METTINNTDNDQMTEEDLFVENAPEIPSGPTQRFTNINPDDSDQVLDVAHQLGLSEAGANHLVAIIAGNGFLSNISITDLTTPLQFYANKLRGTVDVKTSRDQKVAPGSFTFLPGVPQRLLLVTGKTQTKLKVPDQITGCPWGEVQTSFLALPETTTEGVLKSYRPILRFLTQDYFDATDARGNKIVQTNSYFQVTINGLDSKVTNQLADMIYDAALKAGVPKSEMDVRDASIKERQMKDEARRQGVLNARATANQTYALPNLRTPDTAPTAEGFAQPQTLTMPE